MSADPALIAALADRYLIERELGQGGMATVYLAHDVRHDRKVALKVLLPDLAAAVGQDRFLREIRTAASLSHPHILPLHDSGEAAGTLFYVMPLATGESLRDRLTRESQLPIDEALQITREVAGALAYAHAQGIVHRDIKPENILLSAGHAVVADFGIAALLGAVGDAKLTSTGISVGTPDYMSPEQAAGETVDGRSDIYSLGCVLYELLAGMPPFSGPSVQAVMARHMTDPVPSIRTVRPTVPATLERLVVKSLAKVPADRFASAAAFAAALPRHVEAPDASELSAAHRSAGRRRWVRAGAALLLLVLGALAIVRPFRSHREPVAAGSAVKALAVRPFQNLTGDTSQAYLAVGVTEQVINSLNLLRALRVINLTGTSAEVAATILRDNAVGVILTGSVRRDANTVRVTVQFSSPLSGEVLPGGASYDGVVSEMLKLQDLVARSVADSFKVSMTPQERSRLVALRPPVSAAAYEAYARGWVFLGHATASSYPLAVASFRRAIVLDSNYAAAWAGLAQALWSSGYNGLVPPAEVFPEARAAALRALAVDSTIAEAYATLGGIDYMFAWDFAAAEANFRRAVALNPTNAQPHFRFAPLLTGMGRHAEAMAEAKLSQELDPASIIIVTAAARAYYNARRYDLAIAQSHKALELDSTFQRAHYWLGLSYEQTARLPEAIRELEQITSRSRIPLNQSALGHAYAVAGERVKAERVLQTLIERSRTSYVSAFDIAVIHAGLRDRTRTLDALDRAFNERASYLVFINVDPRFDAFRNEPRFQDLVRRIGLPAT